MRSENFFIRPLLCLLAGALMVIAQAPWNIWPCMFAGFSLFYVLMAAHQSMFKAFFCGWCFGFGYFGAGLWWIANALLVDGNEFRWVWPLAIAGLPALLAFFPAITSLVVLRFKNMHTLDGFLLFGTAFAMAEWLRGHIFTGFPWNLYAYIWGESTVMMQIVSIGGSYFLTLLTVYWSIIPGFLFVWNAPARKKTLLFAIGLLIFAVNGIYGLARLHYNITEYVGDTRVRLVQANIAQEDKWDPEKKDANLQAMIDLSPDDSLQQSPHKLTFVIWPETAISDETLADPAARALISGVLSGYQGHVFLLTGIVRQAEGKYFNSIAVIDNEAHIVSLYDKAHLVPFGEYIPFQDELRLPPFVQMEGFTSGSGPETLSPPIGPPFSPLVCYEIIFPGAVTSNERLPPQWIVNVTNDSWYGDSPGPRQHFAQARFRAVEEGLPVVRVAGTGISGVISPLGRVVYKSELFEKVGRSVDLPAPLVRPTPYSLNGDTLFFALCAAAFLSAFFRLVIKNGVS
jgi:apolipoprotein N-acyltransferase